MAKIYRDEMTEQQQFFYEHAGYSWQSAKGETEEDGHIRCAVDLALAETFAKACDLNVNTEHDPEGTMADDVGSVELVASGDAVCLLVTLTDDDGNVLASVGNVIVTSDSDPYVRVVGAELAAEHYESIKPREGQPFRHRAHTYTNVPERTIVPTYVRDSELPTKEGACLTDNLADPAKFKPAGWYIESDAGRSFVSYSDAISA